jgi:hypothetical protein
MGERWSLEYGGPGICPNTELIIPGEDRVGFCCPRGHTCAEGDE